jgi:hypothetical protein
VYRFSWVLLLSSMVNAATLRPESVRAWDTYLATVVKHAHERATFLWVDESKGRRERVREGEIVVDETRSGIDRKSPNALIHDWTGAAFIAGARIDDVIAVVRNYDRYKDYYPPTVIHSKLVEQDGLKDRFSVTMMNSPLISRTAVLTDCEANYIQVSDKRWYAISTTTRIQEIDDYGRSGEHRLPVGQGGGYLWRLATVTRFEERDGGVYLEVQALALSRDIPMSLRFFVDPIVKRVSRNSLTESLKQTGRAVGEVVAENLNIVASNP